MSQWDIELGERIEKVEVAEILEKIEEDVAGFPAMVIRDTKGRTHKLTAVDFPSFIWEQIGVGTILLVRIKEEISGVSDISQSSRGGSQCL
jgi:hypothetical protein